MTGSLGENALDSLVPRLRGIAQGRETVDIAQFHFVDLDEIARAYGDRWPAQQLRIEEAAETFLRRRIDASDILMRGGNGFLVVLGSAAGAEAHAVAAQLTHGLNSFFLGEMGQADAPRLSGEVRSVAARDLATSFGDIEVTDPGVERGRIELTGLTGMEWRFEPSWDAKRETLSSWYVTPYVRSTLQRAAGYRFENVAAHPNRFLKIDEAALWIAQQALEELVLADRPALVGVNIHIGTLANLASRARILATLDKLDPNLHRFRLIKIAGVAPGFPRLYLEEIVGILKARLPHIVIGAAWDEPDVAGLLQTGVSALGFSLPSSAVAMGPVVALPQLMTRIADAVAIAHAHHARFFVEGDIPKLLALRLAKANVDNISSQIIWSARPIPEGMLKWPSDRLIAA